MNTFGSDLNKILSARAAGELPADVPIVKADTITKMEQKKEGQEETGQEEIGQKESEV